AGGALHDEEAKARALDALGQRSRYAIEAPEDPLHFEEGKAGPPIAHLQQGAIALALDIHFDVHVIARELHRVVEQVHDRAAEFLAVAKYFNRHRSWRQTYRLVREMSAGARELDALGGEVVEVVPFQRERRAAGLAGPQHLLDRREQPLGVLEHHPVEVTPLVLGDRALARQQRLQVQPDRRHGALQLVRHGVHERIVLFVSPDLTHQEGRIEDEAGDDGGEDEDAEEQRGDVAPRHDDPADVQGDGERDERDAERDEECDGAAAAWSDGHRQSVPGVTYRGRGSLSEPVWRVRRRDCEPGPRERQRLPLRYDPSERRRSRGCGTRQSASGRGESLT